MSDWKRLFEKIREMATRDLKRAERKAKKLTNLSVNEQAQAARTEHARRGPELSPIAAAKAEVDAKRKALGLDPKE